MQTFRLQRLFNFLIRYILTCCLSFQLLILLSIPFLYHPKLEVQNSLNKINSLIGK